MPGMTSAKTPSRRPLHSVGAHALTVALAGAATGCGSSDDESTTSTAASGATTAAQPATNAGGDSGEVREAGNPPAQDEQAIRDALRRGPAASKAARTARITTEQKVIGIETKGTGTIDLVNQRVLLEQELGGWAGSTTVKSYV
jgi:hypothetical protein